MTTLNAYQTSDIARRTADMQARRNRAAEMLDRAEKALAAGFANKTRQAEARRYASNAYENYADAHHTACIIAMIEAHGVAMENYTYEQYVQALADSVDVYQPRAALHRAKGDDVDAVARFSHETAEAIAACIALRDAIKAAPIAPPAPKKEKADAETVARVERTIREEMERINAMYCHALDLGRVLGGLPVTANVHQVTNQHGTTFIRAFYYLDGKLCPLSVILAAYGQLARERKAAEA